jgi:carbonic anhydrase
LPHLQSILEFNRDFVSSGRYEQYRTDRFPSKELVVLTCMDTRLTELLPKAMNLANGDAKIIKTAGAIISHPFGSVTRSILVAIYELRAKEILVVGHHDCGMASVDSSRILKLAKERGIPEDRIQTLINAGIDLPKWLSGIDSIEENIRQSVKLLRNHPLFPNDITIRGLIISPVTGQLDLVE